MLACPSLPPQLTPELTVADRRQKREIRQLEQELHKWQVLVDSITGEQARGPGGAHFNSFHPALGACGCLAWCTQLALGRPCPGSLPSTLKP